MQAQGEKISQCEPLAGYKTCCQRVVVQKIKVFNKEFNLGFGYSRSDSCQLCDGLKKALKAASDQTEREVLHMELAEHQLN